MKIECEQCHELGYFQRIGQGYFRIRHYSGTDQSTGKSKFTYHQQSKAYALSQLAGNRKGENFNVQFSIEQLTTGQEPHLKDSSLKSSGRSLAWLGHQSPTQVNIDWSSYRQYLYSKYARQYASLLYCYAVNCNDCLADPS